MYIDKDKYGDIIVGVRKRRPRVMRNGRYIVWRCIDGGGNDIAYGVSNALWYDRNQRMLLIRKSHPDKRFQFAYDNSPMVEVVMDNGEVSYYKSRPKFRDYAIVDSLKEANCLLAELNMGL